MARFTSVAPLRPGRRQTVQGYTQVVDEEPTSANRLGRHVRPRTTSKKADERRPPALGSADMLKEEMAKAQIVAVLQAYAYDINRIIALVPQGGATREAQSKLGQLKNAIHSDYKHRYAIARSTQLTPAEQALLARAIRDMFFAVQAIGVNSNPSVEWRTALSSADTDIQRCLAELRDPEKPVESVTTDWF